MRAHTRRVATRGVSEHEDGDENVIGGNLLDAREGSLRVKELTNMGKPRARVLIEGLCTRG